MLAWGRDLGPFFRSEKTAHTGGDGCVPCKAWCQSVVGLFGRCGPDSRSCLICLLVQRIRLFRLMWRDFPQARARMQRGLVSLRCGNGGVPYLWAKQLRSFHLVETPLKAVRRVLESSWMDQVAKNVSHRKSCSEAATTPMPRLEKWWLRVMLCIRSC